MLRRLLLLAFPMLLASPSAYATHLVPITPDPAIYERVLIPVLWFGNLPGAFGSQWTTALTVYNGSELPLAFEPELVGCLHLGCPPTTYALPPKQTSRIDQAMTNLSATGVLAYVKRDAAVDARFQLRIADVSRSGETYGTEVPVVREKDLRHDTLEFLDVPLGNPSFRTTLRIYVPDMPGGGAPVSDASVPFTLRVFLTQFGADALVSSTTIAATQTHFEQGPYRPGYGQVTDFGANLNPGAAYRIELEPQDATRSFWGFVTVTNNATQQVTPVLPK